MPSYDSALRAMSLAARFVLAYADDIDHDVQFTADHIAARHPEATAQGLAATQELAVRIRRELAEAVAALKPFATDGTVQE